MRKDVFSRVKIDNKKNYSKVKRFMPVVVLETKNSLAWFWPQSHAQFSRSPYPLNKNPEIASPTHKIAGKRNSSNLSHQTLRTFPQFMLEVILKPTMASEPHPGFETPLSPLKIQRGETFFTRISNENIVYSAIVNKGNIYLAGVFYYYLCIPDPTGTNTPVFWYTKLDPSFPRPLSPLGHFRSSLWLDRSQGIWHHCDPLHHPMPKDERWYGQMVNWAMFSGKVNIAALASINSTSDSTSPIFHVDLCPAISRLQCNKRITSVFFARSLRS